MNTLQLLREVPLFKNVPEAVLKLVADEAEELSFAAGDSIITEGQQAGALFILRRGAARAFRGGDPTFFMLGPGDSIGEASLLDGGPVGLSIVAVERVDLLSVRADHLKKLAHNHEAAHHFFRAVAVKLASRLRTVADAYVLGREAARKK